MPDAESVDPPLVVPRRSGLQDPVGRRRCAKTGGHIITIGQTDGRDATNFVHKGSDDNLLDGRDATTFHTDSNHHLEEPRASHCLSCLASSRKRLSSSSPERELGQGTWSAVSASTSLNTNLHGHSNLSRAAPCQPQISCINKNFCCPEVGWNIRDYCEACHG